MIGRKRKRLGDLLVDAGVVTSEQLGEALKKQRELGLKLGETLIELKFTDENEIVEALHQQMGYPVAKIREAKIAPEVISLLPETIVRKHNVVPFEVDPDNPNILRVAMADPMDIIAIDDLAIVTNMQIEAMVATPSDVRFGIERYYGNEQVAKMAETYSKERREQQNAREKQEEANEEVDNAPIVLLVNKIIEQAVNERRRLKVILKNRLQIQRKVCLLKTVPERNSISRNPIKALRCLLVQAQVRLLKTPME